MLKITRPSGFDITDERVRLAITNDSGVQVAEVTVLANGEVDVNVKRIEDDPTVKFTVV